MHTLEAAYKRILGQMPLNKRDFMLNPGQHIEACGMLQDGWPVDMVDEAITTLQRWPWFMQIGVTCPPWELTQDDWARLMSAKPWERPEQRQFVPKAWRDEHGQKQLELF